MLQRVLFFGLLALVSVPAPAIDFYDVEILVFRQFDSQGDDEELDVPNSKATGGSPSAPQICRRTARATGYRMSALHTWTTPTCFLLGADVMVATCSHPL